MSSCIPAVARPLPTLDPGPGSVTPDGRVTIETLLQLSRRRQRRSPESQRAQTSSSMQRNINLWQMTENPHTLKPLWSFLTLSQYYRYNRITYIIHSSSSSPKPGLKTNPFICDLEKYKDDLNSSTEWGISFGTFIIIIRQFSFLKIEFLTKSLLCLNDEPLKIFEEMWFNLT